MRRRRHRFLTRRTLLDLYARARDEHRPPHAVVGLTRSETPLGCAVLDECVHMYGRYVETRHKSYSDLFIAKIQDADAAKQSQESRSKTRRAKRVTEEQLSQKRHNIRKHLEDMYAQFAYGQRAGGGIRKPKRYRKLGEVARSR